MVAIHPYPSTNMEERYQPAYPGAKFDKCGYCLVHPMVRLCKPNHDIDNIEGSGLGVDSRRADSTNRRQTFPMSSKSLAREPSRMMHSIKNTKEGKNKRNSSDRGYTIITKFCPMCNSSGDSMFPTPEPKASSNRKKQQKTRKQTSSSAEIDIPVPTIVSCERKSTSSGNREDHNNNKGSDSTRWSSRLSTRGSGNDILLNRNPSDSQTTRSQIRPMNEEMEIVVPKMHKMSIDSIHPDLKHQADDLRRASDKSAGEKVEDSDKLLKSSKNHNDDKVTSTALRKGSEVKISRDEHRLRRNRNSLPSMPHLHQSKSIGKSVPERWSSSEHTVRRSNDANDFLRWNSCDVNIIHESELSNPRRFQSIDGALDDSDRCNSTNKEIIVFDKETSESNVSRSRSSNSTSPAQNRVHALRRTGSQRWQHGQYVSQSPPHKKEGSMRETETLKKSGTSKSTSKRRTRRVDGSSNALISLKTTPVASRRRSESIPQDEPTQNELEEKYRFLHSKNKRDEFSSSMPHIHRIGNETELFATSRKMQRSTQLNDVKSNDVVVWNKTPIRRSRSQGMSRASQKQRSDQNKEFRRSRSGCEEFSSSTPQLREGVNGSYASTATRERNERQYFNCLSEDIVDRITDLKAKSSRYNHDGRLKEDAVSASDPPCTEGFQTKNKSLERLQDEMDRERNETILSMKPRPASNSSRRRSLSFDGADSITSKSKSDYEEIMSSSMPPIHLKGNAIEKLASSGQSMSCAQHQDKPIQPKAFRRSRSGWEELSSSMPHLYENTNERFPVNRAGRKSTQYQYDHMLSSSSRDQPSKFHSESRRKKSVLRHDDEPIHPRPTGRRRRSYTIRDTATIGTSKIRSRSTSALPSRKRVSFDLSTDSPEWLVQRQCRYLQRFYRNIHYMSRSNSSADRISRERENEEIIIGNLIDLQGEMTKNRNQGSSISNDDEAVSTGRIQDDTSVTHSECTTRQRGSRNFFGVREI